MFLKRQRPANPVLWSNESTVCIALTQRGKQYEMLLDASEYEKLKHIHFGLSTSGYARCSTHPVTGVTGLYYLHRLLLCTPEIVDHINRNRLDNRLSNLRSVNAKESVSNTGKRRSGNTSRFKGVFKNKNNRYSVQITHHGKVLSLGSFKDEIDAALAYDKKAFELNGDKAFLNLPEMLHCSQMKAASPR